MTGDGRPADPCAGSAEGAASRAALVSPGAAATAVQLARRALADAWALVAPVDCAGCGAADRALCPECALELQSRPLLGTLDLDGATLPIVAGAPYAAVTRRVVLAVKEQGRTELAQPLGTVLRSAVELAWRGTGAELLVPVPGSWAATGRRGFQPVALIARRAGLVVSPVLRAVRPGRLPAPGSGAGAWSGAGAAAGGAAGAGGAAQKSRTLAERLAVDASRWRVSPRVRGRRVVLVDDVVTSGATLRAAVLALTAAGAEVAGCAAIAATPRRVGESSIPWRFLSTADEGPYDNADAEDYREGKEA